MKLLFSFIFLFFLSFQAQAQALRLIEYYHNTSNFDWSALTEKNVFQKHIEYRNHSMDQFDWEVFTNKEILQKNIDYRNEMFNDQWAGVSIIFSVDKVYLVRIEQELELYKMGIKTGLSDEIIQLAEETIALHWENLNRIENQTKSFAGLRGSIDVIAMEKVDITKTDFYKGTWELYTADYETVFNMVKKGDKALYKALASNDEFYVKFITPYVKKHLKKMQDTAEAYYNSLDGELNYKTSRGTNRTYLEGPFKNINVWNLTDMYLNSFKIKKSFVENFKTPIGKYQKELMKAIEDWHVHLAFLGADSRIASYKVYKMNVNPNFIVTKLYKFYDAPVEVKEKIAVFLRNDILYNEKFINTDVGRLLRARVDALINLNYLNVATAEEQKLYKESIEQGIIRYNSTHSFSARNLPLPDVTKKSEEQKVTEERHTHSGSDLSLLDVSS